MAVVALYGEKQSTCGSSLMPNVKVFTLSKKDAESTSGSSTNEDGVGLPINSASKNNILNLEEKVKTDSTQPHKS